jgi:quinoprotein relay system zinc metallohydrolase 2
MFMTKRHRYQGQILGFMLALWPACGLTEEGAISFPLTKVARGIYVHQGLHEDYSQNNHGDIANLGFIVGSRCVAVLDSGGSLTVGRALRAAIKRTTHVPICYVINSHVHPDHILGNLAFREDTPKYIGHTDLPQALVNNRDHFLKHFVAPMGEPISDDLFITPDQIVENTLELDLGGRVILLKAHRKAHTNQDLTVFDRQTKTLWLADLLFIDRIPALDGSVKGWLSLIEELRGIEAAHVIPGHGPVSAPWPEALAAEQRYLQTLVDEIRVLIARGGTLEEALETVGDSEKDRWILFAQYHKRNVSKVFVELEWE